MGIITGIGGAVDGINTVRKWSVDSEADLQSYVASNTKGATGQVAGNVDWNGSYEAYGHTPVRMPGEIFSFTGNMSNGLGIRGDAIVDDVQIVADIEAGIIIAHTVNFSGDELITKGSAVTSDVSLPNPPSSIGTKVALAVPISGNPNSATWVELADVRGWTLSLTCDNQPYVDSGTGGGTKRKKGNLSGEVTIPIFTLDPSNHPSENDVRFVRLYVNATQYWQIASVMFSAVSGHEVDIEAGAIVGVDLNAMISSHHTINSSGVEGEIEKPDLSTYWPF